MKFFFDENFPKAAREILQELGHECFDPRGSDLEGVPDTIIVEEARRMKAVLLTTDRDFFHTLALQYPEHAGIVVIALKQPSRAAILERLKWFLAHVAEEHLASRAFQLRDHTWVARPSLKI